MSKKVVKNKFKKQLGVWLNQADSIQATGLNYSKFYTLRVKLQNDGFTGSNKKKNYFIPLSIMRKECIKEFKPKAEMRQVSPDVRSIFDELTTKQDSILISDDKTELTQARRRKIIKETEYLDQKIQAKKQMLFSEWSERFFIVFSSSFAKFKNSLIDLRLTEDQNKILKENLQFAISNLQSSLNDIKNDYLNESLEEDEEQQ